MPDDGPTSERVHAALEEVLGWQGVSRSPQLAELLRYVVEKTLAGNGGSIKAYSIAVDVLGRSPDFDPQNDPIVRVQARRLRNLLEQFYSSGLSKSGVEIRLPLGRYVPEFKLSEPAGDDHSPRPSAAATKQPAFSPFFSNAALAFIFTMVGVVLAIALVVAILPRTAVQSEMPTLPTITVGAFDNLTGQPGIDADIADMGRELAGALGDFESLAVGPRGAALSGTVQEDGGAYVLRANLVLPGGSPWTTTITAPEGLTDREALGEAARILAAQLGSSGGPLHASGRAWVKLQARVPVRPAEYVCTLLYMDWRDGRRLSDAARAEECYGKLLAASPDNATALAASADIQSWRIRFLARPQDDLSQLLSGANTAVARAVALAPESSFVHEQQGMILGRQGSVNAAIGALKRARGLNPANMDAVAIEGQLLFTDGNYAEATAAAEEALRTLSVPPPWYYLTRALTALREDRFFDAIDAAQAMAAGEDELGAIIALTAAPRAARVDLIDRYRPMVLSNPRYQEVGIMPRIAMRVSAPGVLQRIRSGLVLAGLPVAALDGPFNPDGSARRG